MERNNPKLVFISFLIVIVAAFSVLLAVEAGNEIAWVEKYTAETELPLLGLAANSSFNKLTTHYKEVGESLLRDGYLADWILSGEQNPGQVIDFMRTIRDENELLDASLVSDLSEIYYGSDGRKLQLSQDNVERDGWYYHYREYSADINIDSWVYPETGVVGLYVNIPVKDSEGRYIGVTGGGIDSLVFDEMLKKFEAQWDVRLFLVRDDGQLVYSTDHKLLSSGIKNVDELWNSGVLEQITRRRYDAAGVVVAPEAGNVLLWSGYMPEWDSYLLLERSNTLSTSLGGAVRQTIIIEIVIAGFLFIMVAIILHYLYTRAMMSFRNSSARVRFAESLFYAQELLLRKSFSYNTEQDRIPVMLKAQKSLSQMYLTGNSRESFSRFDLNNIVNGYLLDNTPVFMKQGISLVSRLRSIPLEISGNEAVTGLIIEDIFNSLARSAAKGSEIVFISGRGTDVVFVNASFKTTEPPEAVQRVETIKPLLDALEISISFREAGAGRYILRCNFYSLPGE